MIKVNGKNVDWNEGMTIETVLEKCNYTYPSIVVSVNGTVIHKDKYSTTVINDGDDVKVIHMVAGG
ncbi:MAG: thiamine biosynthesis protein ThiS [Desulfitibacter sp. BRH_c19]|nr:MAG: thiamine biosynthesis protein ThiS [Desulfitibacter sp. BRH_c19]